MVGCGKFLPSSFFAGDTFDFCWNQFLDLLQQERIVLGGHDGRGAMFFAARDFCWNQLFDLLQPVRMVLGRRRHDFFFFAALIFLLETASSILLELSFLLKPCMSFAGTKSMCFAGNTSFLLETHYCLLEPYQLFARTMCFAFQTGVAIFCCN